MYLGQTDPEAEISKRLIHVVLAYTVYSAYCSRHLLSFLDLWRCCSSSFCWRCTDTCTWSTILPVAL